MTRKSLRGGAKKRVQTRLPGNRSITRYKKEKIKGSHCVRCGQFFASVPRLTNSRLGKLFPTQRKIMRPYGGQLCHDCVRELVKEAVRASKV
jgi:large subunit ribosomal protein L34e